MDLSPGTRNVPHRAPPGWIVNVSERDEDKRELSGWQSEAIYLLV